MTDPNLLSAFRAGLVREEGGVLAPLAFQGSASDTRRLIDAGFVTDELVLVVDVRRGPMGRKLTAEGATLARHMKS